MELCSASFVRQMRRCLALMFRCRKRGLPRFIPAQTLPTTALWLSPDDEMRAAMKAAGLRASEGVVGLLVANREATRGMREALGRSGLPLGYVMVTSGEGRVVQFVWNQEAARRGLRKS